MGKIFLMGLLLIVGTVGLAVDFSLAARDRPQGTYSLSDHLVSRAGALQTALAAVSAGSDVLPPAPEGWTRHRAVFEDSLRAYGVAMPATEIEAGKALEKSVLDALPGHERHYMTYEKEGQIIIVDVVVVPQREDTRAGRTLMGTLFYRLASGSEPYISVGGVELASVQSPATGTGRLILGQIDGLVYVSAASNAGDDATKALLQGIDVAALREMVAEAKAEAAELALSKGAGSGDGGSAMGGGCVRRGAGKFCTISD